RQAKPLDYPFGDVAATDELVRGGEMVPAAAGARVDLADLDDVGTPVLDDDGCRRLERGRDALHVDETEEPREARDQRDQPFARHDAAPVLQEIGCRLPDRKSVV